ncbi:hypothetical protein OHA72_27415 [Dactylosporangium sp. NBC_01737]|uniref:hypothetical protein n=1 Tax=Dactylosporangium sp. NBC_01737 TaxID=2975959 RepID=UPI002E14A061|nr:hypothetical protein OHA72_27415 [Dactylosporangium sp. NBC_01737]
MTDNADGIIGWRWLDVRLQRRARRQVRAGPAPSRLRRAATTGVAVVVQVGAFATLLCGAWLCTVRFPSVALLPGAVLLLFGVLTPAPTGRPAARHIRIRSTAARGRARRRRR